MIFSKVLINIGTTAIYSEDFTTYADLCFREFGDRVSYLTTIDEINNVAAFGSGPTIMGKSLQHDVRIHSE
jgi:beta-glucosidase/6-phospho-beta-glucosidase/beta-galactosidase